MVQRRLIASQAAEVDAKASLGADTTDKDYPDSIVQQGEII